MSVYTKTTDFASKDSLITGDPDKVIRGSEIDAEFENIETAISTQDGTLTYLTSVSGTNTITASTAVAMTAYATGQRFTFIPAASNTGAVTLNIGSIGAKAITKNGTTALTGGELKIGVPQTVTYDGTRFILDGEVTTFFNVMQFGAKGDGSTNDTTAIGNAIAALEAAGGGTIYFPAGTYIVTESTLVHDQADISFKMVGDGPYASELSCTCPTSGWIFKVNVASSNTANVTIRDIGFNGPGSTAPQGTGLYLGGTLFHATVENIVLNGIGTGIQLEDVYYSAFRNIRFRNYVTGITGTSAKAAQDNTFDTCLFGDGKVISPPVAIPIASTNMGKNTYVTCSFESSGYIKQIDMTGGVGEDVMINPRFERLNDGTYSWLIPGNNQRYINPSFHQSASYKVSGSGNDTFLIDIAPSGNTYGKGNTFDAIMVQDSSYSDHYIRFGSAAKHNTVKFHPLPYGDDYDAIYGMIQDVSAGLNVVEWPAGCIEYMDQSGTWSCAGGGPVNQWCMDSLAWSTWTADGLTNSSSSVLGPFGQGYTRNLNTPTGNLQVYYPLTTAASGFVYICSVFVLAKSANDTIALSFDTGTPNWRTITLPSTTYWQRVFIAVKAGSTATHYFRLKSNGATGVYAAHPQIEEASSTLCRIGPAGYIPSSTATGSQNYVYENDPRPFSSREWYGTAAPTVGRHTNGDRVWNLDAASGGAPGWVCTASGVPGTWKAMANLA